MSIKMALLLNKLGLRVTYDGDRQFVKVEIDTKKAAIASR